MTPPSVVSPAGPVDPDSDIFGPPRGGPPRSAARPRVSMISAKLRAKEERKRVIQLCSEKLERIKDPDADLRRSVCINNTYYRLQAEVRREKQGKHQQLLNQLHQSERPATPSPPATSPNGCCDLERIDRELSALADSLGRHDDDEGSMLIQEEMAVRPSEDVLRSYEGARRRAHEEVDDKLVQEVLSHFYSQQPASKLLTAIEDEPEAKRSRHEESCLDSTTITGNSPSGKTDFEIILDALRLGGGATGATNEDIAHAGLQHDQQILSEQPGKRLDSCGQAAIFADLNGAAFHSLMASLET